MSREISSERIPRNYGGGWGSDEYLRDCTCHRIRHGRELNESSDLRSQRKLSLLPASARIFYEEELKDGTLPSCIWNPVLRTIFAGVRSKSSGHWPQTPLALLRQHEQTLLPKIVSMLPKHPYLDHVKLTIPAPLVGNGGGLLRFTNGRSGEMVMSKKHGYETYAYGTRDILSKPLKSKGQKDGFVAFSSCGSVEFPPPMNRQINMMPIILGDINSLPIGLREYHDMIMACPFMKEELGKVAYLTIDESFVNANETQRRFGLHVESPGIFMDNPDEASFEPAKEHPWGMGLFLGPDKYEGGIYIASNRGDTTEVWDALVDTSIPGVVENGGRCEHLRPYIGRGTKLEANELIWMTDQTPDEALPQSTSGHRQFFRLVMPYIGHWYSKHSTPNPHVPLPPEVQVIHYSKFERLPVVQAQPFSVSSFSRRMAEMSTLPLLPPTR
ncbi:hypothetical protein IV203_032574 [Nitzschia inconspicua]|uniref:Uncharacterized protein n=1 Tax=Nitzschia inconspicua TaxID=303405 RepID=A0A9K3PF33_9STRA|nr:hypothetical protein IV203_032574 [Nitzschia inconspicua]